MNIKTYTITLKEKPNGGILLSRRKDGFNVHELLGILEQVKIDIHLRFLADKQADKMETIAVIKDEDLAMDFKKKRMEIKLSMTQVAKETGVSKATISRLEQGKDIMYSNVVTLNKFYNNLI